MPPPVLQDVSQPNNRDATYVNVLQGNRLASNGLLLDYEVPTVGEEGVCASFSDEDLEEESKKWQHTLIMYVIGAEHTIGYLE